MTPWILAVLALWVTQTMLPTSLRYLTRPDLRESLRDALGGRDAPPPMPLLGERAARALHNLHEALPVFLTVALLLEQPPTPPAALAVWGAAVFFVARVLYVPAYLSAIPGVRSTVWVGSWVGLGMMLVSLWRILPL